MYDLDTRRAVLNAIICGDPTDQLDRPPHVVSWHIIWLWHARRIVYTPAGQLAAAPMRPAEEPTPHAL